MKNFSRSIFLVVFTFAYLQCHAQNPCAQGEAYRGCKACGTAQSIKGKRLNVQKNRSTQATAPSKLTVAEIRKPANNNAFSPSQQVWVVGYVASIDKGGFQETCNCDRDDLRDIHINIVADPSEVNDKTKYVVVEITPRWQPKFSLDDSDYDAMLAKVTHQLKHKWVRFEGWMLYDYVHEKEAKSTAPANVPTCKDDGTDPDICVWRGTPWEVHPVTKYAVVPNP
ncbi:MAG TPA: hypothetical protein VJ306_02240 [Pyrinomonadaceae bacterium]|jgi:hypothetical protein|nr:hypothetical protein [Pyrinomonadaceae bacterium]